MANFVTAHDTARRPVLVQVETVCAVLTASPRTGGRATLLLTNGRDIHVMESVSKIIDLVKEAQR